MRRYIISIILLFIATAIFSSYFYLQVISSTVKNTDTITNKIACRLFEQNTISVHTAGNINKQDIQIKVGKRSVYANGMQEERIGQAYGWVKLKIYYQDQLISEISHFKTNNWHTHDYLFELEKSQDQMRINYSITGPDAQHRDVQKRWERNREGNIIRIEYLHQNGEIYHIEDQF